MLILETKRTGKYWITAIIIIVIGLFGCESEKNAPPNLIFIMSDDHAFQALSA